MSEIPILADDLVVIGKVVSVYGIRGEVKAYSFVDPPDSPLDYCHWTLRRDDEIQQTRLVRRHLHGKIPAAELERLDDRGETRTFTGYEICIPRNELPSLGESEYYWYQLEGLKVVGQGEQLLGVVDHLPETGANDVMMAKSCADSLDDRERLLPYAGQCVLSIGLATGEVRADWDTDS